VALRPRTSVSGRSALAKQLRAGWAVRAPPGQALAPGAELVGFLIVIDESRSALRSQRPAIEHLIDGCNDRAQPFVWTKTPGQVLAKASNDKTLQTRAWSRRHGFSPGPAIT
jgi:hypothetical protein